MFTVNDRKGEKQMSNFSDLDMLYDYEKDTSAAAVGYMTFSTKASDSDLITRYMQLAQEASKVSEQTRKLILKNGGIT
jgi:hypothetical protein